MSKAKKKGSLTIVNNTNEKFKESSCDCKFCNDTHKAVHDWTNFVPERGNNLQRRMKEKISEIENKYC